MNHPEHIPQTDENIPVLAELAVKKAYRDAVAAGQTIVQVEGGKLVESKPDGTARELKSVAPGLRVEPGRTYRMR